jgi:thiamine pyrophosphate-dependent acetolactate synthase large subunit-like protein
VGQLFAYPVNPIIEAAADIDIRPIIVRQERTGIHMADSVSRLSSGREVGVFVCQNGPGAENAFGGIAQCYAESVPPGGMARAQMNYFPNFSSQLNYQHITKSAEVLTNPASVWDALRRAFISQTMMSPGSSLLASETSRTTFAGPVAVPGAAAMPLMTDRSALRSTGVPKKREP